MLVRCVAIALGWLALLVPGAGGQRARWRAKWAGNLGEYALWLGSREYSRDETRRRLAEYLRDGAVDALTFQDAWRRRMRTPWAAFVLPVAVLAAGAWSSQGVALLRAAVQPLAQGFGERLVTAVPERSFFGKSPGFTWRQFELIRARGRSFQSVDGFAIRQLNIGEPGGVRRVAFATPGFFTTLGFPPAAYAAEQLGAGWVGRRIEAGGRSYRIAGLWPRDFRPALARPDFWIPAEPVNLDTTMVAVLQPGVAPPEATRELQGLLPSAPPQRVVPLEHSLARVLRALWIGFLLLLAALAGFAIWRAARLRGWRLELFFLAKSVILASGIFGIGVACFAIPSSGAASGPFLIFWWTGIFAALAIWWANRDRRLRCPACLGRMTHAVQIGTHGASLLEGVGDELLCEYGHGSLWLPGAPAQAFGPEVWRGQ